MFHYIHHESTINPILFHYLLIILFKFTGQSPPLTPRQPKALNGEGCPALLLAVRAEVGSELGETIAVVLLVGVQIMVVPAAMPPEMGLLTRANARNNQRLLFGKVVMAGGRDERLGVKGVSSTIPLKGTGLDWSYHWSGQITVRAAVIVRKLAITIH